MSAIVERISDRDQLESILDLIQGYQAFYRAKGDRERNRRHFGQLVGANDLGALIGCWEDGRAVGFTTLYFLPSSITAETSCMLNDVFVHPDFRGKGIARLLFKAAALCALAKGFPQIEWLTQRQNVTAQRLYDSLPQKRTEWFGYTAETEELVAAIGDRV